ncbi:15999_t:CDS:10, partial [Acaulospora colombiana]
AGSRVLGVVHGIQKHAIFVQVAERVIRAGRVLHQRQIKQNVHRLTADFCEKEEDARSCSQADYTCPVSAAADMVGTMRDLLVPVSNERDAGVGGRGGPSPLLDWEAGKILGHKVNVMEVGSSEDKKIPRTQEPSLSERPTPEISSPAVKMNSQESTKIRITSHRAKGSAERPIIRVKIDRREQRHLGSENPQNDWQIANRSSAPNGHKCGIHSTYQLDPSVSHSSQPGKGRPPSKGEGEVEKKSAKDLELHPALLYSLYQLPLVSWVMSPYVTFYEPYRSFATEMLPNNTQYSFLRYSCNGIVSLDRAAIHGEFTYLNAESKENMGSKRQPLLNQATTQNAEVQLQPTTS